MTLRSLPEPKLSERPQNYHSDIMSDVLADWTDKPLASASTEENVISIFDVIGEDFWSGGGFTSKRAAAALRSIGKNDVKVQINSPGGDMFEGIAIYNLLRAHPAKVTVEIVGWAASAASIIAMAGDEIVMGLGSMMMVHNAWGMVIGNANDFRNAADLFSQFDSSIADIYEARTGLDRKTIVDLMDGKSDGTFMSASEAVKNGFADRVDEALVSSGDASNDAGQKIMARRRIEAALAREGMTRNQRENLFSQLNSRQATPRDAGRQTAARDAGFDADAVRQLLSSFKN